MNLFEKVTHTVQMASLQDVFDKEELLAFELRQNLAKKAGEEASTRLLLPMIGLLGIVMAILLIPAMMTMNG